MARCPANVVQTTLPDLVMLARAMRPDEQEQIRAFAGTFDPDTFAAGLMLRPGPKFTLLDAAGNPVVAGGYMPTTEGVMDSWMVGTMDGWGTHWRSITKASRWMMDTLLEGGIRRLQTTVLASRVQTCQWYMKSLKMTPEGVWRGYGQQGQDIALFSRLAGE